MKIGISGHQNIRPSSAISWVETAIRDELHKQRASVGVSSLASGADQIFAKIVVELNLELEAVIPCVGYEEVFSDNESKACFHEMIARANVRQVLDFGSPTEEAFFAAGKRVVDTVDFMIFVWDGMPARGLGGTADVVVYTRSKRLAFTHLNPRDCSIQRHLSS